MLCASRFNQISRRLFARTSLTCYATDPACATSSSWSQGPYRHESSVHEQIPPRQPGPSSYRLGATSSARSRRQGATTAPTCIQVVRPECNGPVLGLGVDAETDTAEQPVSEPDDL